jgi:uncharacterized phage infection (PIP) family protein YhgE
VAHEVQTLATRSADAAKKIRELIQRSAERVEDGARLVDKAGATMKEIVTAIGNVDAIMHEIATASEEQSHGIDQVNQAITQMDQVTQQNAALVQQAADNARALERESEAPAPDPAPNPCRPARVRKKTSGRRSSLRLSRPGSKLCLKNRRAIARQGKNRRKNGVYAE